MGDAIQRQTWSGGTDLTLGRMGHGLEPWQAHLIFSGFYEPRVLYGYRWNSQELVNLYFSMSRLKFLYFFLHIEFI